MSSVANNHSEAEYLTKAFREYLEEFECIEIDIVETNKKYPFSFLFNHFFKRNINVSHNKTRVSFLRVYILIALIVMIISSLLTYHITVMITEHAVVNLMSGCFDTVEENYTLEESILEISFEMDELKNEINDLKKNIETKQKNYEKDNEIDQLKQELSKKTHELDKMEDRYNGLMKDFDLLQQKGYEEYVHDKQSKYPVAMDDIEIFKNKDIKIGETGDTSLHGEVFGYYVATNSLGEAYIEYNVEKKYSMFKGKAYISKWAYQEYDNNDERISNANISIQVQYGEGDNYISVDDISGLSAESEPVETCVSIIGATKLRIVIRGGGGPRGDAFDSIIRLGNPAVYRSVPE